MKELIGRLSRGSFEYDLPELETSVTELRIEVEAGQTKKGFFDVFSKNGEEIKGILYSSDDRVQILNNQFVGKNSKIAYSIIGKYLEQGEEIKAKIRIVSNGGELYIPVFVTVRAESIPSSAGEISNIFHFINLVKQEYDEALKIFMSSNFEKIILKDDMAALCLYQGLIKGKNKRRAMEEFIISLNKKQEVRFELSDDRRSYAPVWESYGDIVTITKNTWGYLEINVKAEGDFLTNFKQKIIDEDFAGNSFELSYLIDAEKLHSGMNYGKLIFSSINQRVEFVVTIDNSRETNVSHREINRCRIGLNEMYLDFRMRRCNMDTWAEKCLSMIERVRGFNDDIPFFKLLQAQICLSKRRDEEAKWLLDSVAEEILDRKEENISLYCYYLYVRTLQKRELEQTLMSADIIRKYYENGYDKWELLWILLYLDTSYENNKSLKIARIKEQFHLGCKSTLMYYEALYVFNKQPALLRVLNNFELQVMNFGSKYDDIDLRLAIQISELAMLEKNFRPLLFRILVSLYEKFENKVILTAIISILIRGNKTETKFFKWYELGINADVKVTRLFEYYMYAMPEDYDGNIPNTVLMYYVYNGNLLLNREQFLYCRVIKNQGKQPNVYKNYRRVIEHFAMNKLRKGEMNEYLSVIYGDTLTVEMITEENQKSLVKVLNTWKISCDDSSIKEVMVIHKEIGGEEIYSLVKGVAYVNIYTEDAIILFRDLEGNIYHNSIPYKIERLFTNKDLDEVALARNENNRYLMAKECEQSLKYHKRIPEGISVFKEVMDSESFRNEYKDSIMSEIIEYYTSNYDGEELDSYLVGIDVTRLSKKSRQHVIELMIMRGLYNEVGQYLITYGITEIDPRKALKYCTRVLKLEGDEEDENMVKYCNYAFSNGKYNESILEYLCRYYNGSTKEMVEMWRVSKEFQFESRELEERIIVQILFTRSLISSISTIYDSYYKKGSLEMVRLAYLFYMSKEYFINENPVSDLLFVHIENELASNGSIMDLCKCAYLKYCSERKNLSEQAKMLTREILYDLAKRNILFDFYREFGRHFSLPDNVLDKTTICYRTSPKEKVMINYYLETGNHTSKEYISEEMKQIFKGLYTKSFTLFYGEKLKVYITEVNDGNSNVTESMEYQLDDRGVETTECRYGMLNDILVCSELREESIVCDLANKYYILNELVKDLYR